MRTALAWILFATACGSGTPPAATTTTTTTTTATTTAPAPSTDAPAPVAEPPADKPTKPVRDTTLAAIGLDPAALDRRADPCEDFYQFACGGWMEKTQIPSDLPLAMRSFVDIELRNEAYLHDVLDKARTAPGNDPIMKQVGAFYGSCMDEAGIEKLGTKPVAPYLAAIAKVKDAKSLSAYLTMMQSIGANPLFSFGPTEDFADATKVIGGLDQSGLGLPDRDYYLDDSDRNKGLRTAYTDYAAALLVAIGHKPDVAKQEAAEILALETAIAKTHKDKVAMRDPKGVYNRLDRAGVAKAMPHFEWDAFFKTVGQPKLAEITVSAPEFLSGVDALLVSTPANIWRNYLTVRLLGSSAEMLPKKFQDIRFELDKKISGSAEQRARWKRCVGHVEGALAQSLGQIYVRERFPGASKTAAEEQVHAIVAAMNENIDALPWMDATTKQKAHEKAAAMAYHIGYPDAWRTYTFKIDPKSFAANTIAARTFETARQLAKIGKPVDRKDWDIPPTMVNAFYNPLHNKMVYPAGILQTPFYQVDRTVAVNLGAMGMVVGHELTHGFDDQGSQFDAKGNMTNWWQPETEKAFKQRTQCVVDQYSQYESGGGKVNGKLTLGENIADIGGLKLALAAYRSLRSTAANTDVADGFTEDQQFFLSFAQTWCTKMTPEYAAMQIAVDPHSPSQWRVNGTLRDTPDFARAFRCKIGAAMRPKQACVVW